MRAMLIALVMLAGCQETDGMKKERACGTWTCPAPSKPLLIITDVVMSVCVCVPPEQMMEFEP